MDQDTRLNSVWWALRIGLGVGPFLAGLDKFFNILTDWTMYLAPWVPNLLGLSAPTFMRIVGVVEMVVGLAILTAWTRVGSYVAMAWLVAIAANLVSTGGFYDLAVRDLEIAIGAYALARLTEVRQAARASASDAHPSLSQHRHVSAAMFVVFALSLLAAPAFAAETWKNAPIIDTQCQVRMKDDPDAHTAKCALQCAASGFGILTADGAFLRLDEEGNKKALEALKATKLTDRLRVTVTGDRKGDTIQVTTLSLDAPAR
ncbi:MAG TPA: DoxX family protein [Candidatus Polarisedimenticolia bacterium]|nr:DoxX family protein [Candidatus Polarisedimenticolia bacterium]